MRSSALTRSPARLAITAAATFAVASLLVFVLPLSVPVRYHPTISASYVVGFNNPVAIVTAAVFSVAVFVCTLLLRRKQEAPPYLDTPSDQLDRRFIAVVVVLCALVMAVYSGLVAASHLSYLGDAGYFIQQATTRLDTGRALYTQLEFAYGPLLLLPEVWLAHLLRCSVTTAYYITLIFSWSLGLLLLAGVLNELPIRRSLRRTALVLFALGAITPFLGLNYTFGRFAPAMAVLLYSTRDRSPWRCALLLTAGEVLVLLISPELALALAFGIAVFAFARACQQGKLWLVTGALPLVCLGALLLTFGRPYMAMIASFSGGTLNLPIAPYPHILVMLFALGWVVPVGLGRSIDLRDPQAARLLGFYALSLAYLPAALSRCDPLHVFFNGAAFFILSLAAVSRSTRRVRRAWLASILLFVLWEHFVNDRIYEYRIANVLRLTVVPLLPTKIQYGLVHLIAGRKPAFAKMFKAGKTPEYTLDIGALEALVGEAPVVTPLEVSPVIRQALRETHHAQPGYFGYFTDVMNAGGEARAVAEFNTASWALLPDDWEGLAGEPPAGIRFVQGVAFPFRLRHPIPYMVGRAFKQNLVSRWTPVHHFGPYTLYRNQREMTGAPIQPRQREAYAR